MRNWILGWAIGVKDSDLDGPVAIGVEWGLSFFADGYDACLFPRGGEMFYNKAVIKKF